MPSPEMKREFLSLLRAQLSSPDKIDKAVYDRKVVKGKVLSLSELEAYGIFNQDGSINKDVAKKYNIEIDESRIKAQMEEVGLTHLSMREQIIIASAIASVVEHLSRRDEVRTIELSDEQDTLLPKNDEQSRKRKNEILQELTQILENNPNKGLAQYAFQDFWPKRNFKFTDPLGFDLTGDAWQMLGMGQFQFKDTNISISPGPSQSRTTVSKDHYDPQRDISDYINNIMSNDVAHIFAIGRVLPYHPQDGYDENRPVLNDTVLEKDFINYFIPDANGHVRLPDIPELKDVDITSKPIKKVGRITTYQISINGGAPIQVHHYPLRDKQPLDLTEAELAYIRDIGRKTPPEKKIHTHCRGGRGRSGQVAYLLAAQRPKYNGMSHEKQLEQMRVEKVNHGQSASFIETPLQENYLEAARAQAGNDFHEDPSIDTYSIYAILLKSIIDKHIDTLGTPTKQGYKDLNIYQQKLVDLMELFHDLSAVKPDDLRQWAAKVKDNELLTDPMVNLFKSQDIFADAILYAFEHEALSEQQLLFNIAARHVDYDEMESQLLEKYSAIARNIDQKLEGNQISRSEANAQRQRNNERYPQAKFQLRNAYLRNYEHLDSNTQLSLRVSVSSELGRDLSRLIKDVLDKKRDDQLDKETWIQFKKDLSTIADQLHLLESVTGEKYNDLSHLNMIASSMFSLDFEALVVEPENLAQKVEEIYKEIIALKKDNALSSEQWDKLHHQFKAYQAIFDQMDAEDNQQYEPQFQVLARLFQGGREKIFIDMQSIFIDAVRDSKPQKGESLSDYISGLGMSIIDSAIERLPTELYGEEGTGEYAEEINALIEGIQQLVTQYSRKVDIDEPVDLSQPKEAVTTPEAKVAQQAVIGLIKKFVPAMVSTSDLRVQFQNLHQDIIRLAKADTIDTAAYQEIDQRFKALTSQYKVENKEQDNLEINRLMDDIAFALYFELDYGKEPLVKDLLDIVNKFKVTHTSAHVLMQEITGEVYDYFIKKDVFDNQKTPQTLVNAAEKLIETLSMLHSNDRSDAINLAKKAIQSSLTSHLLTHRSEPLDLNKEHQKIDQEVLEKFEQSKVNVLRIKAMGEAVESGTRRTLADHFFDLESIVENKEDPVIDYPKLPKLLVFDVDDTLIDLDKNELKRVDELIELLLYAKERGIDVAIATNRRPAIDAQEQTPVNLLKNIIREKTGIDISNMLTYLDFDSVAADKSIIIKVLEGEINDKKAEIRELGVKLEAVSDKETIQQQIDDLEKEIRKLDARLTRLAGGKNVKLDAIRRHYQAFKNINRYQDIVQGGVLKDFKAQKYQLALEAFKDFSDNKQQWDTMFAVAEAMMESKSLGEPKPTLMTIFKDLILDADKPERLRDKYGELDAFEKLNDISMNQSYFKDNLPAIEHYYNQALAFRKRDFEKKDALNEEDILFFDDNRNIIETTKQTTNYRAVKVSDTGEESFRYMVDANYEMGVYNGVIAYLTGDNTRAPKGYGADSINKTLRSYLSDRNIPNFSKHEFNHTPIVKHVKMSVLTQKLNELSSDPIVQKRYKRQFIEAAIERYDEMPKALQDDFVKTFYDDLNQDLIDMNEKLKGLINNPPEKNALRTELTSLKATAERIIQLDSLFAEKIGPTFLTAQAKMYRGMVVPGLFSNHLEHLTIDNDQVKFSEQHEEAEALYHQETIKQAPEVYSKAQNSVLSSVTANLEHLDLNKKQYEALIKKELKSSVDQYVAKNDSFSRLNEDVKEDIYPSLQQLIEDFLIEDIQSLQPEDPIENAVKHHDELVLMESLLKKLTDIAPYQKGLDALEGREAIDYDGQIKALMTKVAGYRKSVEASPQYKAKLFLDKAEAYLTSPERNWKVGFQLTTYVIEGTNMRIPQTVAKQLAEIKAARRDGNFVQHKENFMKIGRDKELSWTSSKSAKQYYSLFKAKTASDDIEEKVSKEFDSPTTRKK